MRPVVSQTNLERIESYQGEHFDDKLGALLLRVKVAENNSERIVSSRDKYMDMCLDRSFRLHQEVRRKSIWKSTTITLAVICIGLIVYISL